MIPYVYKLTRRDTGEFYIGYRRANTKPAYLDLPEYQTSSNTVKGIGFDKFDWEIIAELEDADEAYWLEQKLISESFNNPLCLNEHCVREGQSAFKNVGPMSDESKRKMSEAKKGKKHTPEHNAKIAEAGRGRVFSDEDRKKMSTAKMGQTLSEETRRKISDTKSVKTYKLISPDGEVFIVNNLNRFCSERGLNSGNMSSMLTGKLKTCNGGWTGEYHAI